MRAGVSAPKNGDRLCDAGNAVELGDADCRLALLSDQGAGAEFGLQAKPGPTASLKAIGLKPFNDKTHDLVNI